MADLALSPNELKALASDTRTAIVKILGERNHTLTELSKKMALSAPTVKQHIDVLLGVGIIEVRDEGRKWKYYCLSRKGRTIISGKEGDSRIFIVLAVSFIALLGVSFMFAGYLSGFQLAGTQGIRAGSFQTMEALTAPIGAAVPSAEDIGEEQGAMPSEPAGAPAYKEMDGNAAEPEEGAVDEGLQPEPAVTEPIENGQPPGDAGAGMAGQEPNPIVVYSYIGVIIVLGLATGIAAFRTFRK